MLWRRGAFTEGMLKVKGKATICSEGTDGAGILQKEAQFTIDQVYLIYKAPMPLSAQLFSRIELLTSSSRLKSRRKTESEPGWDVRGSWCWINRPLWSLPR